MGFFRRLFRGAADAPPLPAPVPKDTLDGATLELLKAFLQADRERSAKLQELDLKKLEIAVHREELEYQNLERVAEQKRKDAEAKETLKQRAREYANKANAIKREKARLAAAGGAQGGAPGQPPPWALQCEECRAKYIEHRQPANNDSMVSHRLQNHDAAWQIMLYGPAPQTRTESGLPN